MDGAKVTGLWHTLIMRAVQIGIQGAGCLSKSVHRARVMGTFKEQQVHRGDHENNMLSSGTCAYVSGNK